MFGDINVIESGPGGEVIIFDSAEKSGFDRAEAEPSQSSPRDPPGGRMWINLPAMQLFVHPLGTNAVHPPEHSYIESSEISLR